MNVPLEMLLHLRGRFPSEPTTPGSATAESRPNASSAEGTTSADQAKSAAIPRPRRFMAFTLPQVAATSGWAKTSLDAGRLREAAANPRYLTRGLYGLVAIWGCIGVYMIAAPSRYTSQLALILPGAGASTYVNLSGIGQASSSSVSPYASPLLSPSVLYKNLLESPAVIDRAARSLNMDSADFGKPVVKLVDETSLIRFKMVGTSPMDAHDKAVAMQNSILAELDKLRDDEIRYRESSASESIRNYQSAVDKIRDKINALQSESGLTSGEQYASIVQATETLQTHVEQTQSALGEKESAVISLATMLRTTTELAAATLKALADPELASLSAAAAKDAAAVAEMEERFGPRHPKYLEAQSRAVGTRSRLITRGAAITGLTAAEFRDHIDMTPTGERVGLLSRLVTLSVEREGLVGALESQRADLQKSRTRVQDLLEPASRLETLTRDYKVADAVFTSALARINASKTDVFASYPMMQVAETASVPTSRSSPDLLIAGASGLVASVLLMIGLILSAMRLPLIDTMVAQRREPAATEPVVERPNYAA